MEKVNDGYKCETCSRHITNYRQAKKHERLCGLEKLNAYIPKVENIVHYNKDDEGSKENIQLKIGERFIGECPKCGSNITSRNDYNNIKNYFECPRCEKVVTNKEGAEI